MNGLSWLSIFRLGLVQTALGAMVVLTTTLLNRVMVVELAMAATVPGALVGLHHALQISRPRWGYDSDMGGRRTPWMLGGMVVLGLGVILAAVATAWMSTAPTSGIVLAVAAYVLIGVGVGAAGTTLLAMLAAKVAPGRRAPAATIVWLMMIFGFAITANLVGRALDPFTPMRLVTVISTVVLIAWAVTLVAAWGVESTVPIETVPENKPPFKEAFAEVWAEPKARAFTVFVFVSMLAYQTQDLILEPFAGTVFQMTPGESTKLGGSHHMGVALGMLVVAFAAGGKRGPRFGSVRIWTVGGCLFSGASVAMLVVSGYVAGWPLEATVFSLGLANGMFAAAAIGWMMTLAGEGRASREGVRMGIWGGAQAIAFALGGFFGTVGVDVVRLLSDSPVLSYAAVFGVQATLFVLSGMLAARLPMADQPRRHEDGSSETLAPVGALELMS